MAAAEELMQRLGRISPKQKLAILVGIVGAVAAGWYFMFYQALADEGASLDQQIVQLQQEKAGYEDKKQRYMAFRAEVKKLLQEKKELVKVLPTEAEIPSFLQSLHAQAELAGLNILTFDKQPEVVRDFYAEIPVRMVISGTYHQIGKFFHSVGHLRRIVNIQDVLLSDPTENSSGVMLKAKFVSSTFRFVEKDGGGQPRAG